MTRYLDLISDTICSPITAPGYAGVSVVRVSGDQAQQLLKDHIPSLPKALKTHQTHLGFFRDKKNQKIDQVLVTYFEKGRSFTGDETMEISCHGNPLITNGIVDALIASGCRLAERGEFSFRAFYNGKIDLVQAESIQQLVMSKNQEGSKTSLGHLGGNLSQRLVKIEEEIVLAMSHLEATIDFVEQDIDPKENQAVAERLKEILFETNKLIQSYDIGKNIKEGFKVLLLGPTNVGKSSLFNALFEQEKVIVTDVAGTTRDLVSGQAFLGNNVVEFVDSAGIRQSDNPIESIGIKKSREAIEVSDLVLFVVDSQQGVDFNLLETLPLEKTLLLFNKMDLADNQKQRRETMEKTVLTSSLDINQNNMAFVSALQRQGLDELKEKIEKLITASHSFDGNEIVVQARHHQHLLKVYEGLQKSMDLLAVNESPDIISQELSVALMEVHQVLGKEYNDEVLDKIFSEFCIGK